MILEEEWKEYFYNLIENLKEHGENEYKKNTHIVPRFVFHHCKLSEHQEVKRWMIEVELHPKNHTTNRGVWKVKIKKDEDLTTSLDQ